MTVAMVKLRRLRTLAREKGSVAKVRGEHEGLREHRGPRVRMRARWWSRAMSGDTGLPGETAHEAEAQTAARTSVGSSAAAGVEGLAGRKAQLRLASQEKGVLHRTIVQPTKAREGALLW